MSAFKEIVTKAIIGKGKKYYYYIFSKGGFTEGLIQAQNRREVKLIGLDDLYA